MTNEQLGELVDLLRDWRAVGTSISTSGQLTASDLKILRLVKAQTDGVFSRLQHEIAAMEKARRS